jgi:hypothetical protein
MEKNNHLRKMKPLALLLIVSASCLFIISSCKNKKTETKKEMLACDITLAAADLQAQWVTPDYTKPGDPNEIDTVDIVVSYDPVSKQMQVTLKGMRKGNTEVKGSDIKLFDGTSCSKPAYTSIPEHNYFKLADLGVLDGQGKLTNFNYIRFVPQKYSRDGSVMNFALSVFTGGVSDPKDESLPCPPCLNCNPPCPEDCTPACTKEDSALVFKTDSLSQRTK